MLAKFIFYIIKVFFY